MRTRWGCCDGSRSVGRPGLSLPGHRSIFIDDRASIASLLTDLKGVVVEVVRDAGVHVPRPDVQLLRLMVRTCVYVSAMLFFIAVAHVSGQTHTSSVLFVSSKRLTLASSFFSASAAAPSTSSNPYASGCRCASMSACHHNQYQSMNQRDDRMVVWSALAR